MKKTATLFFVALMAILVSLPLTACNNKIERYEIVELNNSNIIPFEYGYIEFNYKTGTYVSENKVETNGFISQQKGHFSVDADNYVTITDDDGSKQTLLYPNEVLYFKDDEFIIEGNMPGIGKVSVKFKK